VGKKRKQDSMHISICIRRNFGTRKGYKYTVRKPTPTDVYIKPTALAWTR